MKFMFVFTHPMAESEMEEYTAATFEGALAQFKRAHCTGGSFAYIDSIFQQMTDVVTQARIRNHNDT